MAVIQIKRGDIYYTNLDEHIAPSVRTLKIFDITKSTTTETL